MTGPQPRVFAIGSGDAGTRAILNAMLGLIRSGARDQRVRNAALQIVEGISGRDSAAQIRAIRSWLETHFVFRRDPAGAEGLWTPVRLLAQLPAQGVIYGDCDDAAILGASLARSVGCATRLVTVSFQAGAPMAHVWAEAADPAGHHWQELDVTRPAQGPFPAVVREWVVPV